jgi:hypothetical protein
MSADVGRRLTLQLLAHDAANGLFHAAIALGLVDTRATLARVFRASLSPWGPTCYDTDRRGSTSAAHSHVQSLVDWRPPEFR